MTTPEPRGGSTPWFVYLLECVGGSYYAGIAKDLRGRFEQHQAGKGAAYTRAHPPVRMLAAREYSAHGAALRAEYAIKQLRRSDKLAFFEHHERLPLESAEEEVGEKAGPRG